MNGDIGYEALEWAFSGSRRMSPRQFREVKAAIIEAKIESRESPGKKRSRFWGLGPKWARKVS